ncbi:MAG: hypothetical protein RI883_1479 [Bacteroidota bacterium]|jgi:3-oxoacyl-[acyl-carrier protein] reductase
MINNKKIALITGASKGIGSAIAIQLSKDHDCHILINYKSDIKGANTTLDEITNQGGSGEILQFDVSNKIEVDNALNSWKEKNPNLFIEIVVNNAGILKDGLMMWMPESDWDDVVNTSLKGMYNVTQSTLQEMLKKRNGRIINIASLSGLKGLPGQTNYSAAKGGMIAATKALAQEVAKRNVTVNAIAPGFIETAMVDENNPTVLSGMIPAGRLGKPTEVAYLVSFLASDKAAYINGEVININGGLYS